MSASATPVSSGSAVQIATTVAIGDAASNGGLPVLAMATTVHASEKMSEAGVRGLASSCSGDMNATIPMTLSKVVNRAFAWSRPRCIDPQGC